MSTRRTGLFRSVTLGLFLTVVLLMVPNSSVNATSMTVVQVGQAQGVDLSPNVVWILALGSDARPGEKVTRSRADAIQLVGINTSTGAATAIGVPRDSWVNVPGRGMNKINAAMVLGGPQLMARAVRGLIGIEPDYVMVTDFPGLRLMIDAIGGVTVRATHTFSDPNLSYSSFTKGNNKVSGRKALAFARVRKPLRNGDFDRSANQQELLRAIQATLHTTRRTPGLLDRGTTSLLRNMDMQVSPVAIFRLARAVASVRADRITMCVIGGSYGFTSGGASIVVPNKSQARRYGRDAAKDAVLKC